MSIHGDSDWHKNTNLYMSFSIDHTMSFLLFTNDQCICGLSRSNIALYGKLSRGSKIEWSLCKLFCISALSHRE